MSKENLSLGIFMLLLLASGIAVEVGKYSSGLEAFSCVRRTLQLLDVRSAKDFKHWCVKHWKCPAGLALNG